MFTKQLQMLLELLSETEYVTADVLARSMDCSTKTVRTRLRELDDCLKKHGAALCSKAHYGYRLEIGDPDLYRQWLDTRKGTGSVIPQTAEARFFYLCSFLLKMEG